MGPPSSGRARLLPVNQEQVWNPEDASRVSSAPTGWPFSPFKPGHMPGVLSSVMSSRLLPRHPSALASTPPASILPHPRGQGHQRKNQSRLSPRKEGEASLIIQSKASITPPHTHTSSNLLSAISTASQHINNLHNGPLPSLPRKRTPVPHYRCLNPCLPSL